MMLSCFQAAGKLYAIPGLGKYTVFVSTREQVNEVASAPIDQLSFNAAIDEVRIEAQVMTKLQH